MRRRWLCRGHIYIVGRGIYGISRGVSDGMYEQNRPIVYKNGINLDLRFSIACSMPYALPWACTH